MKILNFIFKIVKAVIVPITTKMAVYTSTYYALPLMITTVGPIPSLIAAGTYIIVGPEIIYYVLM